jgi:hypothetical protein
MERRAGCTASNFNNNNNTNRNNGCRGKVRSVSRKGLLPAFKYERVLGEAVRWARKAAVLVVPREGNFAPIKVP